MLLRRDPTKALQIGFLALLVISIAQVGYWIIDHVYYTRQLTERLTALYSAEAQAIEQLAAGDAASQVVDSLLPHLAIDRTGAVSVRPQALAAIVDEGDRRTNRYLWEGAFFLAVLFGALLVLTRAIRQDAELRRRQQNFLAAVSHEFKSPLASMRLAAETLQLRATEPDTRRIGQRILEDGDRLLHMVDNLLDTNRLEEGRTTFAPRTFELQPLLEGAVTEISERARLGNIDVTVEISEPLTLRTDSTALQSILRNLLDNAVKACLAGGGHRIAVRARREGDGVRIEVSDDGVGFPPQEAVMIFEKFYRLGDELRRSMPGTGLGLYIVKRLAELGGGRVSASSAGPGKGATFVVWWPMRQET